jgi:hypothetical protein
VSDEVVNVTLPDAGSVTGAPSALPLSRKVTVPVGVPGVVDVTVAVKVTACPTTEGFTDEAIVAVVAAPVDCVAVPLTVMANGLFGALVVMKTVPLVWNPVKTSFPGENETVMVQDAPGAMDAGQLLLAVKFSEARKPTNENAVSPALLNVTVFGGLLELIG